MSRPLVSYAELMDLAAREPLVQAVLDDRVKSFEKIYDVFKALAVKYPVAY